MSDFVELIQEIYDAVGCPERWQRISERLADRSGLSPEIEWHLQTAAQAHAHHVSLTADIEMLSNTLDRLGLGTLVVDREMRLIRANTMASRLLRDESGLCLVNDRVKATSADGNAALRAAIGRASAEASDAAPSRRPFVLVMRPGRPPLSILALCLASQELRFFEDQMPVILLLHDPDLAAVPGPDVLRVLFGLTMRETELGGLLMRGLSVSEAARALGITIATARTLLAHLTVKTDTHTQAELVGRLMAIPPVV